MRASGHVWRMARHRVSQPALEVSDTAEGLPPSTTRMSILSLPMTLFGLYYTLSSFVKAGLFEADLLFGGTVFTVVEWIYFVYSFLLIALILWALASLAAEMKLYSVQSNAWRNLTFLALYQLIYFIIKLPIPHASAFVLPITLLRYLCIFLNVWLFFRCYRFILPEGSDAAVVPQEKGGKLRERK